MSSFNVRIGNLSLRTTERTATAEIIGLNDDGAVYVIASWTTNSSRDEWSLHFVCNRPFEVERERHFWKLAKLGQFLLDSAILTADEEV